MEYAYSKIVGLPVFEAENMRPKFLIEDIIIDNETGKIVAFLADGKRNLVITPHDILAIKHGVWIKDASDLGTVDDILRVSKIVEDFGGFLNKKVITESGKVLGKVVDMYFDSQITQLTKLYVAKNILGFIQYDSRILPMKNVIEAGKDAIIVKDDDAKEKVGGKIRVEAGVNLEAT